MNNDVIKLCGDYPEDFKKIDISDDINYVFTPDESYENVKLYDSENNSVFVNSFTECEHYVSGGWNYNPISSNEIFSQNVVSVTFLILGIVIAVLVKRAENES